MRTTHAASVLGRWHVSLLWLGTGLCVLVLAWLVMRQPTLGFLLAIPVIAIVLGITLFFGWDGVLSLKRVVSVLIWVAILFPPLRRLPGELPDVRPEFIIVLAAWGLIFLGYFGTGYPIRLRRCPAYKWFWLFGCSIVLSMGYATWLRGLALIWRDFWELAKVFLYFLIFALVTSQNISPTDLKRYYKMALFVFVFSAVFGFFQYIDFAGINEIISPYYATTHMSGMIIHGRITGTTGYPNEFGALMTLAASLALAGGLFLKERKLRLLCWGTLPVFGLALVLTLSRSALVSLFLAGATVLFLFLRQKGLKRRFRRLLTFVLLGCVIVAFILQVMPEKAFYRYGELMTFTEATSWQARVAHWETNFSIWLESPWLGWGPAKAEMGTLADNEWLFVLRRYGVVGLTVFLCLFGSLFFGLSRVRRANSDPSVVALTVALQGTFVGYTLYMMLVCVYHSLQLMPIFLLFLGLAYSQWRPRRTIQEEGS